MTDLSGRVCLVTGATRGIGRETAEALAAMGATILLHGRDPDAVDAACNDIKQACGNASVFGCIADFSSLADLRRFASEIAQQHDQLDLLINNAGTAIWNRTDTVDGFEWLFGVNHLAPFLLTNLLLDRLKASAAARIVTVSSMAHVRARIDFDDLNWARRKYSGLGAYGASKLANILFTSELARRLEGTGITANCLHPGVVATNIFSTMGILGKAISVFARPLLLSPAKGAETSIYLASSPEVADVSGKFFDKCKAVQPAATARDTEAARRLWDISEQMTGLR